MNLKTRLLVAALVSASACAPGNGAAPRGSDAPPDVGNALTSEVASSRYSIKTLPNAVAIYTADIVTASESVELVSARPDQLADGAELLATRVTFLKRLSSGLQVDGIVGNVCTNTWPPPGFGPATDVRGVRVQPGERVAVHIYVRFARPGDASGVVYRYRSGGKQLEQRTSGSGLSVAAQTDAQADYCGAPSFWIGDPNPGLYVVTEVP